MSTVHPMSNCCKHYDISLSGASHLLTYVSLITVKIQENEKKIMKKLILIILFFIFSNQSLLNMEIDFLIVFVDIECNIGFLTTTITYEASITPCNYCPHLHAATMLHYYNITCTCWRMKTTTWCKNNNFLFMGCTVIECLNLFA